jgi:hypothetical protein
MLALFATLPIHLVLSMDGGLTAKTLFLLGILDMRKDGVYFDGSNSVKLGPLSRLGGQKTRI